MPYVSARYAPPDVTGLMPEPKEGAAPVIATDDQGVEWFLTEDSQVGDWLRFRETENFSILAHDEEPQEEEEEPEADEELAPAKAKAKAKAKTRRKK